MTSEFDLAEAMWLRKMRKQRQVKTISGVPPLTFKAKKAGTLKDYRIYGNTVDGESVGDRTDNLFYKKIENANVSATGDVHYENNYDLWVGKVTAGETYTAYNINLVIGFFTNEPNYGMSTYNNSRIINSTEVCTFTVPSGCSYVAIRILKKTNLAMLNIGSTALPYEPYGYKIPVTVREESGETITTNIYLDEPLAEGESISMSDTGVAIPTYDGKNILSVDTTVSPSNIMVKGNIKKIEGRG